MSSSNENSKNIPSPSGNGERRLHMKTMVPNRYMSAIKQGADLTKTKKGSAASKGEVKGVAKVVAPIKVQSQPTLSEEDKLDHLYLIYLQQNLLHGYVQEKTEFVNAIQNEMSTIAAIRDYLTTEKSWFELLANEKLSSSMADLTKIEEVNEALDILHPFVTQAETEEQVQKMQNTLSATLDAIPVSNISVQMPLDFSELKDSVDTLDKIMNSDNLFALSLDVEKMKAEVTENGNQIKDNIEQKSKIKTTLSTVTSLKICDSYSTVTKDAPTPCKDHSSNTTVIENPPIYQSTPFPI